MFQTEDIGVCPKAARACPNPKSLNYLENQFFSALKIFRECFSHYFLSFLTVLAKSNEAISR